MLYLYVYPGDQQGLIRLHAITFLCSLRLFKVIACFFTPLITSISWRKYIYWYATCVKIDRETQSVFSPVYVRRPNVDAHVRRRAFDI